MAQMLMFPDMSILTVLGIPPSWVKHLSFGVLVAAWQIPPGNADLLMLRLG